MPFDATGFPHEPKPPRRSIGADTVAGAAIIALALGLLIMPISLSAIVDLVRYARGH